MAALHPYPFAGLIQRAFREPDQKQSLFDLPLRRIAQFDTAHDIRVSLHGQSAACPLGPAAGPHTQLAQNIALSWLAGGRIIELKTIQIKDDLIIPRPCIDMATIGYNVEWSQELRLEQSLEEYTKAAMLIAILSEHPALSALRPHRETIFEISVGYDLAGIQSERVSHFLRGMLNAEKWISELRNQIPSEFSQYRDIAIPNTLARSATISTFHGCPPGQIEGIADHLLREYGLSCTLKLNPTLLGREQTNALLHGALGYTEIHVPESAFENDPTWAELTPAIERLSRTAESLGLGFAVKFSNTLVVNNHRNFFPSDQTQMYLSGPPLHVLAMHLVKDFRRIFGDRIPLSFSGGIDALNFSDAVALGLVPVTVCTDWLKTGGYARAHRYFNELYARMNQCQARSRDHYILKAYGHEEAALSRLACPEERKMRLRGLLQSGERPQTPEEEALFTRWMSEAILLNTESYVATLAQNRRYAAPENTRSPKKIGRHLTLFDCIACDKCVPVCPNDANFVLPIKPVEIPIQKASRGEHGFVITEHGHISIGEKHQIANFAGMCNECGNCDIFCPEDGGPYHTKPRFFSSREHFSEAPSGDGFFAERRGDVRSIAGRIQGAHYELEIEGSRARYTGPGFQLEYQLDQMLDTLHGHCTAEADLSYAHLLRHLLDAVLSPSEVNFVNCLPSA